MTEPEHTFTVRYRVVGRSLYEQLADWAEDDGHRYVASSDPRHDPATCPVCTDLDARCAEVLERGDHD